MLLRAVCLIGMYDQYFLIGWTGACHAYPFGGDKGLGSVSGTGIIDANHPYTLGYVDLVQS